MTAALKRLKPAERDAVNAYYVNCAPATEVERQLEISSRRFRNLRKSLRKQFFRFVDRLGCERAGRREEAWYGGRLHRPVE
jgi:hypothetical protein